MKRALCCVLLKGLRSEDTDGSSKHRRTCYIHNPQLNVLHTVHEDEDGGARCECSGVDSVSGCVGLCAAGVCWEHRVYVWWLGVMCEVTGESEFGCDGSSSVFAGGPDGVCSPAGIIVGRRSLGLGLSEPLDTTCKWNSIQETTCLCCLTGTTEVLKQNRISFYLITHNVLATDVFFFTTSFSAINKLRHL